MRARAGKKPGWCFLSEQLDLWPLKRVPQIRKNRFANWSDLRGSMSSYSAVAAAGQEAGTSVAVPASQFKMITENEATLRKLGELRVVNS